MGITDNIRRMLNQTAVYWAKSVHNGYNWTYLDPVEITCRWVDKTQMIRDDKGNDLQSRALVYTDNDTVLEAEGYLYLGTLASLTADQKANPKSTGAILIKKVEHSTELNDPTSAYRKYWLTPLLT